MPEITRRRFIQDSTLLAAGLVAADQLASAAPADGGTAFASRWDKCHDRVWLGPEYWANPLQDWRIAGGRAE
jgi:hypothetical protein